MSPRNTPDRDLELEPHEALETTFEDTDDDTSDVELISPFDPKQIRIDTKPMTVDLLKRRMENNEIDLSPDFQRTAGLWKDRAQSRLIESLLIRIPIPAFYMDATNEERWVVVDGLQRLTVLRRFMIDKSLRLSGLEFLRDQQGKTFDELPRALQRRIEETQVTVYLIQPGTPPEVKFNLFKRINTGGLPLSPQEVRHALNQGPGADLLKQLAEGDAFRRVAGSSIKNQRMLDRECVLRFLSFAITPPEQYTPREFDVFLNEHLARLNKMSEEQRDQLSLRFNRAMKAAYDLFGDDAFRKRFNAKDARRPINKALFEAWSLALDALDDAQLNAVVDRREQVKSEAIKLLTSSRDFEASISQGTGDPTKVKLRFSAVRSLIERVLAS